MIKSLALPEGRMRYPKKMEEQRETLLRKFEEEKQSPNMRKKLLLIAEAMMLFSAQCSFEAAAKMKAMERTQRDRNVKGLLNG